MDDDSLELLRQEFAERVKAGVAKCHELGYHPSVFEQMLETRPAHLVAQSLVTSVGNKSSVVQTGLEKLAAMGRLDLSIETTMLDPRFEKLFDKKYRDAARWQLAQVENAGGAKKAPRPGVSYKVNIEDIERALAALGGEAKAKAIQDWLLETYCSGLIPTNYDSDKSFRQTVQRKIEDYCPEAEGFDPAKRPAKFTRFDRGMYRLIGGAQTAVQGELEAAEREADASGAFDPTNTEDARPRVMGEIVRRRGQPAFRKALIEAYGGKCAVTGCNAVEVLEAAHISAYRGDHTNTVDNGLLLRADIHTLFDLGFLRITGDGVVRLDAKLANTEYQRYEGKPIDKPAEVAHAPSREALKRKFMRVAVE